MKQRSDFTVKFAGNGIIVTPVHPDYSRERNPDAIDDLVFNELADFVRWLEGHAGFSGAGLEFELQGTAVVTEIEIPNDAEFKPLKAGRIETVRPRFADGNLFMEPLGPIKGEWVGFEESDDSTVDALREAEAVVRRFTGVKP